MPRQACSSSALDRRLASSRHRSCSSPLSSGRRCRSSCSRGLGRSIRSSTMRRSSSRSSTRCWAARAGSAAGTSSHRSRHACNLPWATTRSSTCSPRSSNSSRACLSAGPGSASVRVPSEASVGPPPVGRPSGSSRRRRSPTCSTSTSPRHSRRSTKGTCRKASSTSSFRSSNSRSSSSNSMRHTSRGATSCSSSCHKPRRRPTMTRFTAAAASARLRSTRPLSSSRRTSRGTEAVPTCRPAGHLPRSSAALAADWAMAPEAPSAGLGKPLLCRRESSRTGVSRPSAEAAAGRATWRGPPVGKRRRPLPVAAAER
mmetsp:Transcript_8009/g.23684  ORF Transcript_8009/g.23684 Transcript_8009/m.23684 type:complete len:315 (+) Transcript_8009:2425-3369(+)